MDYSLQFERHMPTHTHIDMDEVDLAATEEALRAADYLAQSISIKTSSPDYIAVMVECGLAIKNVFVADHSMGLKARQTVVRGFIERTPYSQEYFHSLRNDLLNTIERSEPVLFHALTSIYNSSPEKLDKILQQFWHKRSVDDDFMQGEWREEYSIIQALKQLYDSWDRITSNRKYSFISDFAKMGYKVHKVSPNATEEQKMEGVCLTLSAPAYPDQAANFTTNLTLLAQAHPNIAKDLLHHLYFLDVADDTRNEFFKNAYEQVVPVEQKNHWNWIKSLLIEHLEHTPFASIIANKWISAVVERSTNVIAQWEEPREEPKDVFVEQPLDKKAIEDHRTAAQHVLVQRLKIA